MDNDETVKGEESSEFLTTNQGARVNHTNDSLKAGNRGPTIMDDFHFREKMMHFDHERIPERIVHARGSAAHGTFKVYDDSMKEFTKAKFLTDPSVETPVFVRFSTVVGFRGSADTVRDARGFATKFYTSEGNYDLVGNNIPVFFIQDAIKFPDLVHAIKPEPHNEVPQASAAHDNFWDFISLMPESMHMIMWVLSDRALPRSYSMMEGFGVHTFRLINESGVSRFVKFHWKPMAGIHSLAWDETQKIAGKDPDFNRKDLWESIEMGNYPEYEFGVQIIEENQEFDFDFDILDATKLWPEELVPVRRIGKMVLNKNPDNFFAETEQVAFHPGHLVPGIDVSNDPLLQGRLFSYLDTQIIRLGGPNFAEIPINRPHSDVSNNQRDGFMRQKIDKGKVNYFPNSLGDNKPMPAPEEKGGYVHYPQKVEGVKTRERSETFLDHFSQATLFWNSMTPPEKKHILEAFHFELGKVEIMAVRERMVQMITKVDMDLAREVAKGIGVEAPTRGVLDKADEMVGKAVDKVVSPSGKRRVDSSPALSQSNQKAESIKGRKVAVLLAEGYDSAQFMEIKKAIEEKGAKVHVISKTLGKLKSNGSDEVTVEKSFVTTASVLFDAVFVAGGKQSVDTLKMQGGAIHFINEAYKHCKPIGATGEGVDLLSGARLIGINNSDNENVKSELGIVTTRSKGNWSEFNEAFIKAIAMHRFWEREANTGPVPA